MDTDPGLADRRAKDYHQQRLVAVQDLDKAASYLLASNYSYLASPTKSTQGLIHNDCVAVVVIAGKYYMASNFQRLDDGDAANLNGALGCGEIEYQIVVRGKAKFMHAEMQLLEELVKAGIDTKGVFMGVSKPCCNYCHKLLNQYGIGHTAYHTDKVENWDAPDLD